MTSDHLARGVRGIGYSQTRLVSRAFPQDSPHLTVFLQHGLPEGYRVSPDVRCSNLGEECPLNSKSSRMSPQSLIVHRHRQ